VGADINRESQSLRVATRTNSRTNNIPSSVRMRGLRHSGLRDPRPRGHPVEGLTRGKSCCSNAKNGTTIRFARR